MHRQASRHDLEVAIDPFDFPKSSSSIRTIRMMRIMGQISGVSSRPMR